MRQVVVLEEAGSSPVGHPMIISNIAVDVGPPNMFLWIDMMNTGLVHVATGGWQRAFAERYKSEESPDTEYVPHPGQIVTGRIRKSYSHP